MLQDLPRRRLCSKTYPGLTDHVVTISHEQVVRSIKFSNVVTLEQLKVHALAPPQRTNGYTSEHHVTSVTSAEDYKFSRFCKRCCLVSTVLLRKESIYTFTNPCKAIFAGAPNRERGDMSHLNAGTLFRVNDMVFVITGAGSGRRFVLL